jgi:hypothetical protein
VALRADEVPGANECMQTKVLVRAIRAARPSWAAATTPARTATGPVVGGTWLRLDAMRQAACATRPVLAGIRRPAIAISRAMTGTMPATPATRPVRVVIR